MEHRLPAEDDAPGQPDRPPRYERCVLVGLPGAGKSAVGAALAGLLGWRFLDIDREITRRTGRTIADVFRTDGETAFRAMEARLTAELSSGPRVVVAPGGGWAAQAGVVEGLPADSAVVWLRVSPAEAIRRLRGSPEERPLLSGPDPLGALGELAAQRESAYARADLVVVVDDRAISEIALTISEWLRRNIS